MSNSNFFWRFNLIDNVPSSNLWNPIKLLYISFGNSKVSRLNLEFNQDRVGGGLAPFLLPHHRTYGSVYGGSRHSRLYWRQCPVPYKHPALPLGFRPILPALGSPTRHLLKVYGKSVSHQMTGSALHRVVYPTNMASADFCQPFPTPYDIGSTRQAGRPPRVKRATFTFIPAASTPIASMQVLDFE